MKSTGLTLALLVCMAAMPIAAQKSKAPAKTTRASHTAKLKAGDAAPDFKLQDQDGKDVSLSDFKGKKNVALAFYVFAFTGG